MERKYFFIFFTMLIPWLSNGQAINHESNFDNTIFVSKGDLNKDNIPDSIIVLQDTLNDLSPYRLKIYLTKPDKNYFLAVQSDSLITPEFPNGKDGYRTGEGFIDITIKSGILSINCELLRGHYENKFRYKSGNFELIGFSQVYSDGQGKMYTTDFNLSTGWILEISERYDTDELLSKKKKKKIINPLPKLQNFTPSTFDIH